MTHEHDLAAALEMHHRLAMDFRHQRTGGVDREQVAAACFLGHRFRHAMGGEDHRPVALGHLVEFLDEDRPLLPERLHDIFVMDDFVADIDRRAVFLERALDHVDRPHHACTKAAWRAQKHAKRRFLEAHFSLKHHCF